MNVLIELPTWLGDAVMATPALESLVDTYPHAEITLVGSAAALEALRAHPGITTALRDDTKSGGIRVYNVLKLARKTGRHDLAVSFRSHIYSRLLLTLSGSAERFQYVRKRYPAQEPQHQVLRYHSFISDITGTEKKPGRLKLYWPAERFLRPAMGINPGATYGSAKRWYPERFAEVAAAFSSRYDIFIFGGLTERGMADEIETLCRRKGVTNIKNMAGKTTIPQLCSHIAGLDLFITGDSGPMHIAAAYSIPTVSIFGPTRHLETSQWMNPDNVIVRREMECAPCMKRTCPLGTHACMKEITGQEVIEAAAEVTAKS